MSKEGPARAWLEFGTMVPDDRPGIRAISICGLCGNQGYINTLGNTRTPSGEPAGVRAFCICPNGRAAKRRHGRKKWGGSSVLQHEPGNQGEPGKS